MKNGLCLLILMAGSSVLAQSLTLRRGNEVIPLVQHGDSIWVAQMDGKTFYLIERSIVDSLTKKIEIKDAVIRRHEKVLAAQEALLGKYENYERAADAHIAKQSELLAVADSLYQGYQSLYFDVKKLLGFSTLSVSTGVGLINRDDKTRPAASIGLNYGRGQLNALVGKDAWGVSLGVGWKIK